MNTPDGHYQTSSGYSLTYQPSLRVSLSEESCLAQVHGPEGGMSQRLPGSFIPWQDISERPPPRFRSSTGSSGFRWHCITVQLLFLSPAGLPPPPPASLGRARDRSLIHFLQVTSDSEYASQGTL